MKIDNVYYSDDTPWGGLIEDAYLDALNEAGYWSEPSIQGGQGEVLIWTEATDECVACRDYEYLGEQLEELWLAASTKEEFKASVLKLLGLTKTK